MSLSSSYESGSSNNVQVLSKQRSHTASYFYGFCINFMEEAKRNGRQFRNDIQALDTAALRWQQLTLVEKEEWRKRFHREKASGSHRYKIQNGDRGPATADPTYLARLKDPKMKSDTIIQDLVMRWNILFDRKASGLATETFLVVSASLNTTGALAEIAIVAFNIDMGTLDQFRIPFGAIDCDDLRYQVIEYILDWPRRLDRRLNDGLPNFFVLACQIPAVFAALTFVGTSSSKLPAMNWKGPQICLRDLASVEDLRRAMYKFVDQEPLMVGEEVQKGTELKTEEPEDCLDVAQRCVGQLVEEFRHVLKE